METLNVLISYSSREESNSQGEVYLDHGIPASLFCLAQGWGQDTHQGLVHFCTDSSLFKEGLPLYFKYYITDPSEFLPLKESAEHPPLGVQKIYMENVPQYSESPREITKQLISKYRIPAIHHYPLFTRVRLSKESKDLSFREQWMLIRMKAWAILARSSVEPGVTALLRTDPETVSAMAAIVTEPKISGIVRGAAADALTALSSNGIRAPNVITACEWSLPHGRFPTTLRTLVAALRNPSQLEFVSKDIEPVIEGLLSCANSLTFSSNGPTALNNAGIFSVILPLLSFYSSKLSHLRIVAEGIQLMEGMVDYDDTTIDLFRNIGGVDELIKRLEYEIEMSVGKEGGKTEIEEENGEIHL